MRKSRFRGSHVKIRTNNKGREIAKKTKTGSIRNEDLL